MVTILTLFITRYFGGKSATGEIWQTRHVSTSICPGNMIHCAKLNSYGRQLENNSLTKSQTLNEDNKEMRLFRDILVGTLHCNDHWDSTYMIKFLEVLFPVISKSVHFTVFRFTWYISYWRGLNVTSYFPSLFLMEVT